MHRSAPSVLVTPLLLLASAELLAAQELAGRVVDVAGRGLAGATVELRDAGDAASVEARTDAEGRFRFESAPARAELHAALAGHALVEVGEAFELDGGGFEPCELVLQRAGVLALSIEDEGGAGLERVEFEVAPLADGLPEFAAWNGRAAFGWTDASGRVELEPVWAGVPLAVTVWGEDGEEWRFERCTAGQLAPADEPGARAIRVEPGARKSLGIALPPPLVVRGRALTPAGRTYDWSSWAHLVELDPGRPRLLPTSELRAALDDQGRFELRVHSLRGPGPLGISVGRSRHPGRDVLGVARIDPPRSGRGELEVALVLDGGAAIAGRVEGALPGSARWTLCALPARTTRSQAVELLPRLRTATVEPGGAFELRALPAGSYDLELVEGLGAFGEHVQRFPGLLTGAAAATLAFEPELSVRVRVRAVVDETALSRLIVLAGRIEGSPSEAVSGDGGSGEDGSSARLGLECRPAVRLAWPVEVDARDDELALVDSPEWTVVYRTFESSGARLELPPTGPGRYVLGAYARGRRGRSFAAVVTDPLELGPGYHEVWLDLRPTEPLRGRVLGAGEEPLYYELRDEWGELITARRGMRDFARRFPVRDDGTLYLSQAPVGALRVWLGSEDELDEGRFRMERLIEHREGEFAELVFDLRG